MITNKTIGRATCPVCGEPNQDVRLSDKNGKLYIYCDNGCRTWLNGQQSKFYKSQLLYGHNVSDGKILIKSIVNGVKQNETKLEQSEFRATGTDGATAGNTTGTTATGATGGRIEPIGRPNNNNTSNGAGRDSKRSAILEFLLADD